MTLRQKVDVAPQGGKSAADISRELEEANKKIRKHNAERIIFGIVIMIFWNDYTFKGNDGWAPVISKLVLELIVVFVLSYRFGLHEIIKLYWSIMRAYGKSDPGEAPKTE